MADEPNDDRRRRHEQAGRDANEYSRLGQMADEAAERAVAKVFRGLGIDLRDMDDVNAFRDDMRFTRLQRTASEARKAETNKTAITAIGGLIVGAIGSIVTWLLAGGHKP